MQKNTLIFLFDTFQVNSPLDSTNFDKYPQDTEIPPTDDGSGWDEEF